MGTEFDLHIVLFGAVGELNCGQTTLALPRLTDMG